MTVIDYLEHLATLHGVLVKDQAAKIRTAIERTDLAPKAEQAIATLSRGYRQRVGVAQAILHRPTILILDEPTGGLDPGNAVRVKELIRQQRPSGTTVFLTTHDMSVADELCDRVASSRVGSRSSTARGG